MTRMNISLSALWSAAIRSKTDGNGTVSIVSLGILQAVSSNYLSLCGEVLQHHALPKITHICCYNICYALFEDNNTTYERTVIYI